MVCNFDPRHPPHFMKHVLTQVRKIQPDTAARWEKEYQAWTAKVEKDRPSFFDNPKTRKLQDVDVQEEEGGKTIKKRRLGADKRMALDYTFQQSTVDT